MNPEYDAFISYSSHDKLWVYTCLLCELERAGLDICIDRRDFDLGIPSIVNMERAIKRSRKTILVMSSKWVESEWTNFESLMVQTYDLVNLSLRVLPILFENCQIPLRLSIFTYADFTSQDQWGAEMNRLIATIKEARNSGICTESALSLVACDGKAEIMYSLSFEGECENITVADLQIIQAVLQQYAKDATLRIRRVEPGSVILEITSSQEGYYRLCRLVRLGKLSELVGLSIIGISTIVEGREEVTKRIRSGIKEIVIPSNYQQRPLSGVFCRLEGIEGFEVEGERARQLLPGKTGLLSDVVIYVTAQGEYYYAHSNYVIAGHSHASKMCSTDIPDLFYILIYMIGKDWPSPEQEIRIYEAHKNKVQYIINEKIMREDGTCEIDVYDATNIKIVKDIS
jgi:hypothetical protein